MPDDLLSGENEEGGKVLLHACCAPCSSAIVEWLTQHHIYPIIFYYNPNIWPREEYEIRKNESKRHAESLGLTWIDGDYDHQQWREDICGLEQEPECGKRCECCFTLRLTVAAKQAKALGLKYFTTTLASSRWKRIEQIERAGHQAEKAVPEVTFWAQNWRKGGLYERRNQLLKEFDFYNQQYCGCEFSAVRVDKDPVKGKEDLRQQMREAKKTHSRLMPQFSKTIVDRLRPRLKDAQVMMAYWPLPDEVDIRPLINEMVSMGRTVVLPKVLDDETMELRRYTTPEDLREGAFHIQEPVGLPFTDFETIDVVLVPAMALDASGHRLGRGKGYYDRFLSAHPDLHTIGVCFPFQQVAQIPVDEHDVKLSEITFL